MKVTGFSFIRNAEKFDYPIVEAIRSILPLCDNFVVAVGNSEDKTLEIIKNIDPQKIAIIQTVWDDTLREGGKVLAQETNKAFQSIASDADWAFYIQGDEVIHEKYHPAIRAAMEKWKDHKNVEGLLFKYLHFYGSYNYIGISPRWYKNEIRIVKNDKTIYSFRDAQGFRKKGDQLLKVKPVDAFVYHYGWVKDPRKMQAKQESFHKLWHSDGWMDKNIAKAEEFNYSEVDALEKFNGTHPAVMQKRIKQLNWEFDFDPSFNKLSFKDKLKNFIHQYLGLDFSYKNYKKV